MAWLSSVWEQFDLQLFPSFYIDITYTVLSFLPIKGAFWGWAKLTSSDLYFFCFWLPYMYLLFQWWSLPMFWFLILQSSFQVACFKCLQFAYKTLSPSSTKFCATISSTSQATVCLQYLTLLTFCSLNICVLVSWMCWTFGQLFESCTNDINIKINPIKIICIWILCFVFLVHKQHTQGFPS